MSGSGLEKITREIIAEAKDEAQRIIKEAMEKSGEIISLARRSAQTQSAQIMSNTNRRLTVQQAASDGERKLLQRQAILRAHQNAINEALDSAKQELLNLPDNEYFALCIKLAAMYAQNGQGELLFNTADRARMPDSFPNLLKLALSAEQCLSVSGDTTRIDGGFVLRYGKIEENCSFSAIFYEKRDVFTDLIRECLFEGAK
ncbi:MAG: hypothetical protein LBL96_06575 [Clostridiales bacterium]|jgi:V/A-type H+-transporting ATPase subunit E|nr:hypothetical protein [Clostridiales bacterium]